MSNEIVKILDADVVTAVENPHYRVDVAALNLARGLSRGDSLDTPAYKFQMELLTEAVRDYSMARGKLTREVVDPLKDEAGVKTDASWSLDFSKKQLTITPVGPEITTITDEIIVDKDDVAKVSELDILVSVYANIIERVGDTFEKNGEASIKALIAKQAEVAKAYDLAKNEIQEKYVQPYLQANDIDGKCTWTLDFQTQKITITKVN